MVRGSRFAVALALLALAYGCTIFRVLTDQPGAATEMENGNLTTETQNAQRGTP
jgi:hypothetical protein